MAEPKKGELVFINNQLCKTEEAEKPSFKNTCLNCFNFNGVDEACKSDLVSCGDIERGLFFAKLAQAKKPIRALNGK